MHSVFKFAFIAGLTFLVAAEVAYGQAQAPDYGTNDPGSCPVDKKIYLFFPLK